jgi:hypothetical protein
VDNDNGHKCRHRFTCACGRGAIIRCGCADEIIRLRPEIPDGVTEEHGPKEGKCRYDESQSGEDIECYAMGWCCDDAEEGEDEGELDEVGCDEVEEFTDEDDLFHDRSQ